MVNEKKYVICEACNGTGEWEVECCNGSDGCSCGGQLVSMGVCNVCEGTGERHINANTMANVETIQGHCFIGTGPTSGIWANRSRRLSKI